MGNTTEVLSTTEPRVSVDIGTSNIVRRRTYASAQLVSQTCALMLMCNCSSKACAAIWECLFCVGRRKRVTDTLQWRTLGSSGKGITKPELKVISPTLDHLSVRAANRRPIMTNTKHATPNSIAIYHKGPAGVITKFCCSESDDVCYVSPRPVCAQHGQENVLWNKFTSISYFQMLNPLHAR